MQTTKPIRLKGKKLRDLHAAAYERDGGLCVECGKWVEPDTPAHHIVFKSQGGSDTLDNLVLLCNSPCHYRIHSIDGK